MIWFEYKRLVRSQSLQMYTYNNIYEEQREMKTEQTPHKIIIIIVIKMKQKKI